MGALYTLLYSVPHQVDCWVVLAGFYCFLFLTIVLPCPQIKPSPEFNKAMPLTHDWSQHLLSTSTSKDLPSTQQDSRSPSLQKAELSALVLPARAAPALPRRWREQTSPTQQPEHTPQLPSPHKKSLPSFKVNSNAWSSKKSPFSAVLQYLSRALGST